MISLDARLSAALEADDPAELIPLYEEAAGAANDHLHRAFFLTHAYVHALETGDARAATLRAALVDMGAEAH